MAAPLTSNHVNYLIWRYLQESGHDKTAVRLQRDWKIEDPERLPFARHIKTHALVSLVQKGLQYHELETSLQQHGEQATQSPTTLFFGAETGNASASKEVGDGAATSRAPSSSRKHARESIIPGSAQDTTAQAPAPKRQRRNAKDAAVSSGVAAAANQPKSGDSMEVDQQQDVVHEAEITHTVASTTGELQENVLLNGKLERAESATAAGSPSDALSTAASAVPPPTPPPPPPVPTLEIGHSVPTQTDGVAEVRKEATKILENGAGQTAVATVWNPQQPQLLASAGHELCRIWTVPSDGSTTNGDAPATNGITSRAPAPQAIDLFTDMKGTTVTAIAWSSDGTQLAVARHRVDSKAASSVNLFGTDGGELDELSPGTHFYFGLSYSPSSALLLGHGGDNSHYEDGSRDYGLCVWDLTKGDDDGIVNVAQVKVERQAIHAATWLDDKRILICGPDLIASTAYLDGKLGDLQPLVVDAAVEIAETPLDWTYMAYDKYTGTCVLAAEAQGKLGLLSSDQLTLSVRNAHASTITGLQYQPLPQHGSTGTGRRIVVSSALDGSIKMWNAAHDLSLLRVLHCDSLDPVRFPALAMQFSPDGATLGVATIDRVVFWRPERGNAWPSVIWQLESEVGWRAGKAAAEAEAKTNGNSNVKINCVVNGVNGINGHTKKTGTSDDVVNEADRMSVDNDESSRRTDYEEDGGIATLHWSAMGKRVAYGYGEQLAIADFIRVWNRAASHEKRTV